MKAHLIAAVSKPNENDARRRWRELAQRGAAHRQSSQGASCATAGQRIKTGEAPGSGGVGLRWAQMGQPRLAAAEETRRERWANEKGIESNVPGGRRKVGLGLKRQDMEFGPINRKENLI